MIFPLKCQKCHRSTAYRVELTMLELHNILRIHHLKLTCVECGNVVRFFPNRAVENYIEEVTEMNTKESQERFRGFL